MCKERSTIDIFYDIFLYIDELVHLIKPRKLLVISADGVAPRAKMNQQRSRRYRKSDIDPKDIDAMKKQGLNPDKMFNSDSISAGTEFMFELSKSFDEFVNEKMKVDPLWMNLKVVLTGADVPGEGEHKIVEHIRNYKSSREYDSNTKHCIYGLDADLIMLSLITHEPNICILREEVVKKKTPSECNREELKTLESFEFIFISILREYLELEFSEIKARLKFDFNIERIIDDFVFFCFFIGNDFLPNLNTLDIDHGALENIFLYYKQVLPSMDDYITYHGKIDFKKAEQIFTCLAGHELNNLEKMLANVELQCTQMKNKQIKATEDKKKILRMKKLMSRKENFLVMLKSKDKEHVFKFKKDRINKKLSNFRQIYENEMKLKGKEVKFEEDITIYINNQLNKNILLDKTEISGSNNSASYNCITHINSNLQNIKSTDDNKGLTIFFDSDNESQVTKNNSKNMDKLSNIVVGASKYIKYLQDDNYVSEINIDDIDEDDIGKISDPEVEDVIQQEVLYRDDQDMDKVFQQKLLNLYITDTNKAKAFYYKEKLNIDLETKEGREEHKNMFRKYLEGLQWVLYYYYRGIQSWRWYYPYHYAPMISDFNKIKDYLDYDIDKCFNYGQPFSPFQSLLFILPKNSRNLFPKSYWGIFEEHPELYPPKFKIDFNGKKMPWESLVLLPFLPEDTILEFERRQRQKYDPANKSNLLLHEESEYILSDRDLERNTHGNSFIYTRCPISKEINRVPFEIYSEFTITNLDSNYSKKNVDYKFPSMKTIYYDYIFTSNKQYFGKQEKRVRVITIKPVLNRKSLSEDVIKSYVINRVIYINFPFKQEACVRGIIYNNKYYYLNNYNTVSIDGNGSVSQEMRETIRRFWNKRGVKLDYFEVLCDVSLLKCIARNNDGSLIKIYDDNYSFYVPFELTSLNSMLNDFERLSQDFTIFTRRFKSIETEFTETNPIINLSKTSFGSLAYKTGIINKTDNLYLKLNEENYSKYYDQTSNYDLDGIDWEISIDKLYNGQLVEISIDSSHQSSNVTETHLLRKIIKNTDEDYISLEELAKKLGVTNWTLELVTSSTIIVNCTNEEEFTEETKISDLQHWNIGLNMKSRNKGQKLILPGYTRFIEKHSSDSSSWEFSKLAVELITQYKNNYSFVFESLEKYKNLYGRSEKFFRVYELFSEYDNFNEKLTQITVWINSLKTSQMSFANFQSAFLSINDCRNIEEYVINKNKLLASNQIRSDFSHKLVLNPNYLFQESYPYVFPFMPYQPPPFQLGDRVINIRSSDFTYVPFGEKGTVTGISGEYIEVLFDNEFLGGSTCQGRFLMRKGAYVKPLNLINVTNKFPVYLRRNKNKYYPWNMQISSGYNDANIVNNTYNSPKVKLDEDKRETKKIFKRNKSVDKLVKDKENQLTLEKVNSENLDSKTNLFKINTNFNNKFSNNQNIVSSNTITVSDEIKINKNQNVTSESINIHVDSNTYVPKRIIIKDKVKINNAFKTNSIKSSLYPLEVVINNEKNTKNESEYKVERLFKNENLLKNQIYYFGNPESLERLSMNKNLIFISNVKNE